MSFFLFFQSTVLSPNVQVHGTSSMTQGKNTELEVKSLGTLLGVLS